MMVAKRVIHLGVSSLATMGERFIDARERAERGELADNTYAGVSFDDFEILLSTLMPRRC